jgi:2-polyprenyl-6-methoxyphenol hydroxylase-like FAD-dependent oxidoreductase
MEFAQNQPVYDVIISGGGPVGLFLACELALASCSVLVLEKAEHSHSPLKQLPFGLRGLNALSMEALDRRGLLHELEVPKRLKAPHAAPTSGPGKPPQGGGHFAGIQLPVGKIDASQWPYHLPSAPGAPLFAELAELETVLARRAEALGVILKRGRAIVDFQQTADGVTVQAGDHSWHGKWLVGCDCMYMPVGVTLRPGLSFSGSMMSTCAV